MNKKAAVNWEFQYLDLIQDIRDHGDDRVDRTGVGTRALFGRHLDIDLTRYFPLMTTKRVPFKSVLSELLWFVEGSSDERRLAEILHGTRDKIKTVDISPPGTSERLFKDVPLNTIWTENAEAPYWKPKAKFEGDLGPVYGVQWRHWKTYKTEKTFEPLGFGGQEAEGTEVVEGPEIDQLAEVVNKLRTNQTDRRMIISAWNVAELNNVALPACHMMAQFFVKKGKLSCMMTQRSVDTMLGLPFNIASYALLTHMLAHVTGLGVDRLILNLGDTHIYANHMEAVDEQLRRLPTSGPQLVIKRQVPEIDQFTMDDFELVDYNPQAAIKMAMAV